jgi:hypothetical protein
MESRAFYAWYKNGIKVCDDRGLMFHDRWDWIMPVVEKIRIIPYVSNIRESYQKIYWDKNDLWCFQYQVDNYYGTFNGWLFDENKEYTSYVSKIDAIYISKLFIS